MMVDVGPSASDSGNECGVFPCEGEMMWRNKGSSTNLSRCCNKAADIIIVRVLASGIRPLWKKLSPIVQNWWISNLPWGR